MSVWTSHPFRQGIQLTEQGQRVLLCKEQQEKSDFIASLKFDAPFEGKCVVACSGAIAQRVTRPGTAKTA